MLRSGSMCCAVGWFSLGSLATLCGMTLVPEREGAKEPWQAVGYNRTSRMNLPLEMVKLPRIEAVGERKSETATKVR